MKVLRNFYIILEKSKTKDSYFSSSLVGVPSKK